MAKHLDPSATVDARASDAVGLRWRRLDHHLWAGRADDRPVGTIEHGRGFVYVDLEGQRHGAFRTLEEAKQAATGPIRPPQPRDPRSKWLAATRLVIASGGIVTVLITIWAALRFQLLV